MRMILRQALFIKENFFGGGEGWTRTRPSPVFASAPPLHRLISGRPESLGFPEQRERLCGATPRNFGARRTSLRWRPAPRPNRPIPLNFSTARFASDDSGRFSGVATRGYPPFRRPDCCFATPAKCSDKTPHVATPQSCHTLMQRARRWRKDKGLCQAGATTCPP